jgi:hypothetical protein
MAATTYPVRVDASLDTGLSRWLWLVKWLLAIPHFIVLVFLWIAFIAVSFIAFFAILFTGHYPRSLFEFNVGVLRWTWRVSYYTYGALGTDRYPPFSLADVPDYPAHLEVSYPEHLSRGLVLVKWWLLAIPQYIVAGIFLGGGTWVAWNYNETAGRASGGLIGILVLIAAIVLAFTGRYPEQIFVFVLGMNRWVLRVAAYAGLMTDDYPPFRMDMGGPEPAGTITLIKPDAASGSGAAPAPPPTVRRRGWTAGRVVSLVIGSLLGLIAFGLLAAGGAVTWLHNSQRDAAGYLTSDTHRFATSSYAVSSDAIDLGTGWTPSDLLGNVRIRATATDPRAAVFVGVGPRSAVDRYLAGVSHDVVTDWTSGDTQYRQEAGGAPRTSPARAGIWTASTAGRGTQALTWKPTAGNWVIVVMNPSGRAGVSVTADAGATVPDLGWFAVGLFAAGFVLLVVSVTLVAVPVVRASRA